MHTSTLRASYETCAHWGEASTQCSPTQAPRHVAGSCCPSADLHCSVTCRLAPAWVNLQTLWWPRGLCTFPSKGVVSADCPACVLSLSPRLPYGFIIMFYCWHLMILYITCCVVSVPWLDQDHTRLWGGLSRKTAAEGPQGLCSWWSAVTRVGPPAQF